MMDCKTADMNKDNTQGPSYHAPWAPPESVVPPLATRRYPDRHPLLLHQYDKLADHQIAT